MLTFFYSLLIYVTVLVFIGGLYWRIRLYIRTPQPYKIPLTPAPTNRFGVLLRLLPELLYFKSLFRANRLLWLMGWTFHLALLLVFLGHLRFITEWAWPWIFSTSLIMTIAGWALPLSLAGLLVLRISDARLRYISAPADYLWLLLLLTISISGKLLLANGVNLLGLQEFLRGLIYFSWVEFPIHTGLLLHISLAMCLFILFPFSKLLHAPGIFFSPTRMQSDNSRK